MKYLIYFVFILFSVGTYSCKDTDKNETTTQSSLGAEKADLAMTDIYQCPMDCENGKTYEEEGDCPKCGMKLKKQENKKAIKGKDLDQDTDKLNEGHSGNDQD